MEILITGTHFTPALAVIEELKKSYNAEIVYVGRKTTLEGDKSPSPESKVLPAMGIKFIPIITGRLQRTFTFYTIPSLFKIPIGFIQAIYIILRQKPDVILSFGGYVAVPVVFSGWLFSIPIIIHEQTLVSGLANKISSLFADKIAISFKETEDFFNREKTILTGNPIRRRILSMDTKGVKPVHPKGVQILVMGGSQGSHVINLALEECLGKLIKFAKVIHITGDNKFRDFERLQKLQNENYVAEKWLDEGFAKILSSTDLVVCRAGINTLTELTFLGIPALVIPIPYLYQDEQNINAKYFASLGLVRILPQSALSADSLLKNIKLMLNDLNDLKEKNKRFREAVNIDAAKRLALETTLLVKNSKVND